MVKFLLPVGVLALIPFVVAKQPNGISGPGSAFHSDSKRDNGRKGLRAQADLTGDQEVPPVDTDAEGRFKIQFNCDYTAARYELNAEADDVLQAHLHCGSAGENGPVVAFLFGLFPGGVDVDGEFASFTLTQANLDAVNSNCMNAVGYQIETLEDLADAITAGDIYANVHTVAFPGGEIRGQVEVRRAARCRNNNGNDNDNDNDNHNENENENDNSGHDHDD